MFDHGRGHASDAPTRLLRQHLFHCKLSDIDVTLEICFGESLKIVRGIVSERLSEKDARIVDDTIYRAENGHRCGGNLRGSRSLADVSFDYSQSFRRLNCRLCDMARIGDDIVAALNKRFCDAGPDPLRRPRDDHSLAPSFCSFRMHPSPL